MTNTHHDATTHDKWRGRKAKLFGTKKSCDDYIATCFHLTVGLNNDSISKTIQHQCLLRLSQTQLPRCASMLERSQRRSTGATVMTRNQYNICFRFSNTSGDRADTDFGNEFDVHPRNRVRIFKIVNQLLEIFNRINVVMRWRRNQTNTGCRVSRLCNPRIHLVRRQLTTLAGFCTLCHFDLQIICIH